MMAIAKLTLIFGAGPVGSALAVYLRKANLPVAMVIQNNETDLERTISFSEARFTGSKTVADIEASLISPGDLADIPEGGLAEKWTEAVDFHIRNRTVPLWIHDEYPEIAGLLLPKIIVKSKLFENVLPEYFSESIILGLSSFHQAGKDCHFAVESGLNYWLGSVYQTETVRRPVFDWHFFKPPFSKVDSPIEGIFISEKKIGDKIRQNQSLGKVDEIEIRSPFNGQIWGLYHSGRFIEQRSPLAIISEAPPSEGYNEFSFYHRAVAGSLFSLILQHIQSD